MLPTTAQFDAAADANTTEASARVRVYREFNAIADSITVSAVHDPIDPRFDESAVVSIRNPQRNGVIYGPMREAFTSDNPNKAFRFILGQDFDLETAVRYYIPKLSGNSTTGDITVDYTKNFPMNQIVVRYENTRNSSTFYDEVVKVYITPDGGAESLVFTGSMNTDGVTEVNYNGTWGEGQTFGSTTVNVRKVRVVFQTGSYLHQPRVMYVGGVHALDVSDDIITVSVDKSEFVRDPLMPMGQPSANTCSVELDNTELNYRFSDTEEENFFLKHQRVEIDFGLNIKYGGGADTVEYVPGGIFYIDDYGYSEASMTANISGRDYASVLQERFCGNYLWRNKSLKYIVQDVLARSGVSPVGVVFDFGVAGNANASNKRGYTWSHESQSVWDFLSTLAKSELGTVFFDEEENLVFTDRLDLDTKFLEGSKYTIDGDTNLESIDEDFEVVANKIRVGWEELELNSSKYNPKTSVNAENIMSYANGAEVLLNQVLWQPSDDESYLGSATLSRNLGVSDTYMYVSADTGIQITREEGEVLLDDEFVTYNERTTVSGGEVRMKIVKRNARNTLSGPKVHLGINANYGLGTSTFWNRGLFSGTPVAANRQNTSDGYRTRLASGQSRYAQVLHLNTYKYKSGAMDYNSKYKVYHCRVRFDEQDSKFRKDDAGGMFINLNASGYGIFFEISNPDGQPFVRSNGSATGNARAYKSTRYLTTVPMPPTNLNESAYGTDFLFAKSNSKSDGTYLDITVLQQSLTGPDKITWYVNGELIDSFFTEYKKSELSGLSKNQQTVGNSANQSGLFGTFVRGSTSMTVDFMYATNNTSVGPDSLVGRGFNRFYDTRKGSYNVKKSDKTLSDLEYYVEFGSPVHEVVEFKVDHDSYPNAKATLLNTAQDVVAVVADAHSPFNSHILVTNSGRIGVNLNDVVFYSDGTQLSHAFLVYGVGVIRADREHIETSDGPSIRRFGIQELELDNPWVNNKAQAVSLANYIRKFWSDGQQSFTAEIFPNPALQPRDRVSLSYPEKGLNGGDTWFVNGVKITYDGGLSCQLSLKRFKDYPDVNDDISYKDNGGINIT